ncbi:MAG: 6-pyruvoyl tetrahydropterin synthase family protein [Pirellulales bacterium]|nr:6-pyruvoyl tetrahydropterin synthase family protein [Pirellulales bacterium]
MSSFAIRIAQPDLLFSASHFITFADGGVEALHGHDYRVTAEIRGRIGPGGYLVDFTEVHRLLKTLLDPLDHRVLLPQRHPAMEIEPSDEEITVAYRRRRWIFPRADCCLLPLANTTAEALAEHLAQQLLRGLPPGVDAVQVEVGEGTGFSAVCTLP